MKTGSKILVVKDYMMEIRVAKLYDDAMYSRKHYNDAGMDLYFYSFYDGNSSQVVIPFGGVFTAHTGITVEIPHKYFGWITNKSKNNFLIGGGIIDEGYQGELLVKIINPTEENIIIKKGMAIAQLLIIPVEIPEFLEVAIKEIHQTPTERNSTGGIVSQLEMKI
jgi:dUTP pyrophosphatase